MKNRVKMTATSSTLRNAVLALAVAPAVAGTLRVEVDLKGRLDPGPFGHSMPDSETYRIPASDINHPYQMGDLINIEVRDGWGHMKHVTNRITLSPGRLSVLGLNGSALIIHAQPDSYCDENSELKTGCSGGFPDACGVITLNG